MPSFSTKHADYQYYLIERCMELDYSNTNIVLTFHAILLMLTVAAIISNSMVYCYVYIVANLELSSQDYRVLYPAFDGMICSIAAYFDCIVIFLLYSVIKSHNILFEITVRKNYRYIKLLIIMYLYAVFIEATATLIVDTIYFNISNNPVFNDDNRICKLIYCEHLSIYYITNNVSKALVPFVLVISLFIFIKRISKPHDHATQSSLLPSQQTIQQTNYNNTQHCLKYFWVFMYLLTWALLVLCQQYYADIKTSIIQEYYEWIYLLLHFYTSMFKYIMKYICKKCDKIRTQNSSNNYIVSMAYMMKWLLSFAYWNIYRWLLVARTPRPHQFAVTLIIHTISEIVTTYIRFSSIYYIITFGISQYLNNKAISTDKKAYKYLHKKFNDNSTEIEWRNRLSMDICARFIISTIVTVHAILNLAIIGKSAINKHYGDSVEYELAIIYVTISAISECAYYAGLVYLNIKWNNYNTLKIFVQYIKRYNTMERLLLCVFFCSFITAAFPEALLI